MCACVPLVAPLFISTCAPRSNGDPGNKHAGPCHLNGHAKFLMGGVCPPALPYPPMHPPIPPAPPRPPPAPLHPPKPPEWEQRCDRYCHEWYVHHYKPSFCKCGACRHFNPLDVNASNFWPQRNSLYPVDADATDKLAAGTPCENGRVVAHHVRNQTEVRDMNEEPPRGSKAARAPPDPPAAPPPAPAITSLWDRIRSALNASSESSPPAAGAAPAPHLARCEKWCALGDTAKHAQLCHCAACGDSPRLPAGSPCHGSGGFAAPGVTVWE